MPIISGEIATRKFGNRSKGEFSVSQSTTCKVSIYDFGLGTRSSTFSTKRANESERKGGPSRGARGDQEAKEMVAEKEKKQEKEDEQGAEEHEGRWSGRRQWGWRVPDSRRVRLGRELRGRRSPRY